ncbi:hypothetical protein OH708_07365 [Pseudomonas capsici]|uniref:hypothetical protein n=1 Tax=Pseudomonas capsici TaxID=2810614 RepID=UPI0021F1CFE8|nr:hypothetical protein [Pseudomonas capsici]MCV4287723.1 hypothetical protein [Pseudomonas capsici]
MNFLDREGFSASPVVLVEQVQLGSFQIGHFLPNAAVSTAKPMKKARQLVWAKSGLYCSRFKGFSIRQVGLIRSVLLSVKNKPPSGCVVDRWLFHVLGLRGLLM